MKIALQQTIWFSPKASRRLRSLKQIFKELRSVHEDYVDGERNNGDCPYWYGERPHTGLLAAAVWRQGGTALEEYGTRKTKELKSKSGRCDLYIRTKNTAFECEAKRLWLNLGKKADVSCQKVADRLNWAIRDVKHLQRRKGLALCFATPVIRESKLADLETRLCEWIKLLKSSSGWDAMVWIRIAKGQKPLGRKFKHVGLLLAIREMR